MNLLKELQATAAKNATRIIIESQKALDAVKENLELEQNKDVAMLNYFGTSHRIANEKRVIAINEIIQKGGFLRLDDIKRVCVKYRLRFLPTHYYVAAVPLKALHDIRKFSENINKDDLFIIAPANHFKLAPRPKSDPVILYKTDDIYEVVSTFGNDFTWTRKVASAFLNNSYILVILFAGVIAYLARAVRIADGTPLLSIASLAIGVMLALYMWSASNSNWNEPFK